MSLAQRMHFLKNLFQMITIVLISVINHYHINGLHLFWDTLYNGMAWCHIKREVSGALTNGKLTGTIVLKANGTILKKISVSFIVIFWLFKYSFTFNAFWTPPPIFLICLGLLYLNMIFISLAIFFIFQKNEVGLSKWGSV